MTATLARSQVEVLRHQLEQAEACGRAFVEVPRGTLAGLLASASMYDAVPLERRQALDLVAWERCSQEARAQREQAAGAVEWKTPADPTVDDGTRLAVLLEEVGEVAHALNEHRVSKHADLLGELVQVAAVSVAWIEALA